ncbi:MAG: alpha/beta hydrolase [Acidimicrobiales bacterium]
MAALTLERRELQVNGVSTVVLEAGPPTAPPLVFFHGAGTFHGWDFAAPWTQRFRVLIPFHPGFGESGDDEGLREVHDFVLHYTDLFDQLDLRRDVSLVGFSLGGLLAARFAIEQKHRLRKLVLVAPAGLRDLENPGPDLFRILPEDLPAMLVHDLATILPYLPADPHDIDFTVARYREMRTTAIVLWEHPFDRVLDRWLGRVDVPTLLVWGDDDKLIPPGQAETWAKLLPNATVRVFPRAGHLVLDESSEAAAAVAEFCA